MSEKKVLVCIRVKRDCAVTSFSEARRSAAVWNNWQEEDVHLFVMGPSHTRQELKNEGEFQCFVGKCQQSGTILNIEARTTKQINETRQREMAPAPVGAPAAAAAAQADETPIPEKGRTPRQCSKTPAMAPSEEATSIRSTPQKGSTSSEATTTVLPEPVSEAAPQANERPVGAAGTEERWLRAFIKKHNHWCFKCKTRTNLQAYCWRCTRSMCQKCLGGKQAPDPWTCPECPRTVEEPPKLKDQDSEADVTLDEPKPQTDDGDVIFQSDFSPSASPKRRRPPPGAYREATTQEDDDEDFQLGDDEKDEDTEEDDEEDEGTDEDDGDSPRKRKRSL